MTIIAEPIASTAALDYDWLLAELARNSGNRTDLGALLPNWVRLAEARLNSDLICRLQDATATVSTVAATATVALPADFGSVRSLASPNGGPLDYLTPDQLDARFSSDDEAEPRAYTFSGASLILAPTPDAVYALTLRYRATLPTLIDNDSNWLLTNYPDAYVCAAMVYVCRYAKNWTDIPVWESGYAAAVAGALAATWNASGPLVVRTDAQTV